MEIMQFGEKAVKIGDRPIPALNVQVEGFPTYKEFMDVGHFFPVYFELPFESGALWTVLTYGDVAPACHEHCMEGYVDGKILVEMYVDFRNEPEVFMATIYDSWDEVLEAYELAAG